MASKEQILDFFKFLKQFKPEPGREPSENEIQSIGRLLTNVHFGTIENMQKLMAVEASKFPTCAEINNFIERIEENEMPDPLGEILRLMRLYTIDEQAWPPIHSALAKTVNMLGGTREINKLQDASIPYQRKIAKDAYKEAKRQERAGVSQGPVYGFKLLTSDTPNSDQHVKDERTRMHARAYQAVMRSISNHGKDLETEFQNAGVMECYRPIFRQMQKHALARSNNGSSPKERLEAIYLSVEIKDYMDRGSGSTNSLQKKYMDDYVPGAFKTEWEERKKADPPELRKDHPHQIINYTKYYGGNPLQVFKGKEREDFIAQRKKEVGAHLERQNQEEKAKSNDNSSRNN